MKRVNSGLNIAINHHEHTRWYNLLGMLLLAVYAVMALVYARERLYGDSAIYLHWLVQNEAFQIIHLRPASYFTQWLPLLGIHLGADLKSIILLHSFSDWPILAAIWVLIAFALRQPALALAMLLSFVIGVRWNYFNPVSELLTGLPFLFLAFAILLRMGESIKGYVIIFALLVFTLFNHKLYTLLVPMCLIWLFLIREISVKSLTVLMIFTIIGAGLQSAFMDAYDTASMQGSMADASVTSRFSSFLWKDFFIASLKNFTGELLLLAILLALLIYRKLYLNAAYLLGALIVYVGLIIHKFGNLYPDTYEPFERYLFPVAVLVSLAFLSYLPNANVKLKVVLIGAISLYQIVILTHYGHVVIKRYNQFELAMNYAAENDIPKLSFRAENYYIEPLGHNWTMVNESVLLSAAANHGNVSQVFIHESFNQHDIDSLKSNQLFCYPDIWCRTNLKDLNPQYFRAKESSVQLANNDSFQINRGEAWFKNLKIEFGQRIGNYPGSYTYLPVTIHNPNPEPLYSGKRLESIWIYTAWQDENGKDVHHCESPVFADVHTKMTQFVRMKNAGKDEPIKVLTVGIYLADSLLIPIATIDRTTLENKH